MSLESIINISCSVVSVIATIIIAIVQIRQGKRMEKFEIRQDKRDEKRYYDEVHTLACKFISKYYEQRGLLPLCAIASMYNDSYHYDRKMYAEFLHLNMDIRKEIMKLSQFDLEIDEKMNLFEVCLNEIEKCYKQMYIGEHQELFYDHGKYLVRALERYGKNEIPSMPAIGMKEGVTQKYPYRFEAYVTDMIVYNRSEQPISKICSQYGFSCLEEYKACYIALVVARYTAIYADRGEKNENMNYGSPGEWAGEKLETMEDMFLTVLFDIYVNLVL